MTMPSDMEQPTSNEGKKINTQLKIATLNVRGLKNNKKRYTIVNNFKLRKLDIISLQETHFSCNADKISLDAQWGGTVHHAFGSSRSKGLATLFNPSIKESDISLVFKNDRVLMSLVSIDGIKFMIINIYSPCSDREKKAF